MKIKELKKADVKAAYDVLRHMYPDMTSEEYVKIALARLAEGYRLVAVLDGDKMVSVAGFWIGMRFYCGKFIQLDNFVTLPDYRGRAVGKLLVDWIKDLGRAENCNRVILDTYVDNYPAHRFFLREGFIIRGYHLNFML